MGFNRRTLKRLEKRGLAPCPECGLSPEQPGHIVVRDGGTLTEGYPDDPAERCIRCGRPLWCVLNLVYDEEGEGAIADA